MGKGRGERWSCVSLSPKKNFGNFFPPTPVSSHGFMVLDHHGELGVGIQRDSLQIPLESLGKNKKKKRGGRGWDRRLEEENPNPKIPFGITAFPKPKFPENPKFSLVTDHQEGANPRSCSSPKSGLFFPPNSLFFWNFGPWERKDGVGKEKVLEKFPFRRNSLECSW